MKLKKQTMTLTVAALALAWTAEAKHPAATRNPDGKNLQRLLYNNPEAVVNLQHGFGAGFFIGDWDKDGISDVCTYLFPYQGVDWYSCGIKMYYSSKGRRLADGTFVYGKGEYVDSLPSERGDMRGPGYWPVGKPFDPKGIHQSSAADSGYGTVEYQSVRGDLNGDGLDDRLVFASDRTTYGWHDRFNARGVWTTPMYSFTYVMWGKAYTKESPSNWRDPVPFTYANGEMMLHTEGVDAAALHDFDGDGDLDLVTEQGPTLFLYHENIGSRTEPKFSMPRDLVDVSGVRLVARNCHAQFSVVDYDRDGVADIAFSDSEGTVAWARGRGVKNGTPVFETVRQLLQAADEIGNGNFATPCAADLDGDGDQDLVIGNEAGELIIVENLSKKGVEFPKWAAPRPVTTPDGKAFRLVAGYNGSIQGPREANCGYTIPALADWDGDGKVDIVLNSIWGRPLWLKNVGTKAKPKFDFPKGIEVEWAGDQPELAWGWLKPKTLENPKEIITQWRTTAFPVDFNGDGLVDLVLCDVDGDFAFWERYRDEKGALRLKPPRKAFRNLDGSPVRASRTINPKEWLGGRAGASGRRKVAVADWDGDGKLDLIVNGGNNARVCLQKKAENGQWFFAAPSADVAKEPLWSHDPAPAVCDFNADGKPDLLFGALDGYVYYMRNPSK